MRPRQALAALALAAALPASAQALPPVTADRLSSAIEAHLASKNYITGEQLLSEWPKVKLFVLGYVTGISDAGHLGQPARMRYCTPAGATTGQMVDVVLQFLEANPQRRQEGASHLVRESFRQSWPCPAEQQAEPRRGPTL